MSHFFPLNQRLAAILVLFAASPVYAQGRPDPNLDPTYGTVTLAAGFTPDPVTKEVQAGGELTTKLGGVSAHVAKAPDFRLNYTVGNAPLVFSVKSVGDTTLLINLPDGTWIADDDSGGGLDPMIRIAKPKSGRYDIYVGSFKNDIVAATLHISARDPSNLAPVAPFNPNLPECHIVSAGIDNYHTQNKLQGCLNDARNTIRAFEAQTGLMYRSVKHRLLLDDAASHGGIVTSFRNLTNQGAAGDTMVLFLSGHGARTNGNKGNTWFFLPVDFNSQAFKNTALTDVQLLEISDQLVRQKKNVLVIIDACYSGQLAVTAQPYLQRYQATNQGGLALLLSSASNQESAALGNYSAFAKAFADSMAGGGDLNGDSRITLGELQIDSKKRTYDLLAASRNPRKQDANVTWSPSLSKDTALGAAGQSSTQVALAQPLPKEAPRRFTGTETLPGFGKLSFALYSNGRAVMTDAKSTQEGIWRQHGERFTLSFANGAVVYTGALSGATLSGTATSPSTRQAGVQSWTWSAQRQAG